MLILRDAVGSRKFMNMKKITKEVYLDWYEQMFFWRLFQNKLAQVYLQQKVRGFLHLYNGQEAILAGAIHVMDKQKDRMITSYRNHVQPIALGLDPRKVMAELYGKKTGSSKGLGGSMHIFSKEHNFFGGHGIVGGQIALGAGIAFADKYHKRDSITITFLGDGAVWQGAFHETMNLASTWKLPVVFCIENNGYAMGTSTERTTVQSELWKLGLGYNMPCGPVDGMDPEKVAKAMDEAVKRARAGEGPTLLELKTYRYRGHSMSDAQSYRTKEEVKEYEKLDPVLTVKNRILENEWATEEELKEIENRGRALVKECEEFADQSEFPDTDVMYDAVYEQEDYPFLPHKL